MTRTLGPLLLLALLAALGGATVKLRLDVAAMATEQAAGPTYAPVAGAPSGLDGRPLDPNIAVKPPHSAPPSAPPPRGQQMKHPVQQ